MSKCGSLAELNGLFGPSVFFASEPGTSVRIFSPCAQKYLVFQDLVIPLGEKSRMVIGSDPADSDMVLVSSRVSPRHATIVYHDGCYFIQDLGSAHGTYLNGKRISSMMELRAGDEIVLKPYHMTFTGNAPSAACDRWKNNFVA